MLDMNSNKPIIYCGKGILERIKEEEENYDVNNILTEKDLYKFILDRFNEVVKPQPQPLIVISNRLTKDQIERIKNYYSNL